MADIKRIHKTMQDNNIRISYREGFIESEIIFENHFHAKYEMIAVFEGKVNIVVDNRKYTLKAGEVAMLPPLVYHSVFAGADVTYKRVTVLFEESVIPVEIIKEFKAKTKLQPVSVHDDFRFILKSFDEMFKGETSDKFFPLAKSLLTEAIYIHTFKETSGKKEKSNPIVKAASEYIDERITEKIALDEIAESIFISKSTLSHVFRAEMKISVKQYILQKKLAYAAKIISDGMSAKVASDLIGYENYANFYKMYKKIIGSTPKQSKR